MIGQGILGQIANPQMADISGALDVREARLARDEARRKEIRMGQLVAEAMPSLRDGPLKQMALENPQGFLNFTKAVGIPVNSGEKIQEFADDTTMLYQLSRQDPQQAYEWAIAESENRKKQGRDAAHLDKFYGGMEDDPVRTITGLNLAYGGIGGGGEERKIALEDRKLALQERDLDIQEQRMMSGADIEKTAKQREWEQYQKLKQEDPDAAAQFGRSTGFETKEGQQLSAFAEKKIDAAFTEYTEASASVNRYSTLADSLRKTQMSGGLKSTWTEYMKEQTGNQDEITALRKEAKQIANSEGIKNLPPGPATDRDIEIVMAPFPTEKASPEYIANWLDAISRLNQKRAEYADFKAEFITANGGFRNKQGQSLVASWKDAQQGAEQPAQQTTNQQQAPKVLNWSDM